MKRILVSACLLGEKCRYDGTSRECLHPIFAKWRSEGRLIAICPEVCGGLPVPRPPCELRGGKALSCGGEDFTAQYLAGAQAAVMRARECGAALCILKENSPSCGVNRVYDGTFSGRLISGQGLCAQLLRQAGFAAFSENELEAAQELLSRTEGK